VYVSETNRKVQVFYKQGQSEIPTGIHLIKNIETSIQKHLNLVIMPFPYPVGLDSK
jgi:hypothetical protein